ncbi:MAG: sensor histidine kinase [Ignavibacteriales bacterium]
MKSIWQRLLVTYMGIFLLTFLVMVLVLTQYLNGYYYELKQKQLMDQGQNVTQRITEFQQGNLSKDQLDLYVNAVSDAAGARIVAVDFGDEADSKSPTAGLSNLQSEGSFYDLKTIKQGKTISRKRQFGTDSNMDVILVGLPIFSAQKNVVGAVLILSPLAEMRQTVTNVTRIIWGIAAAFMLAAGLLIYSTARRISAPIMAVSQAAVHIAEGGEEPDIEVPGQDEVSRMANSFNYMKNRLQQVEEMRQDLISNVSHELRTPLTTMGGFIQAMLDGKIKAEDQPRYLQLVRLETKRLARLVNDILLTAQVQSGNLELLKTSLYIPDVVDEVIQSLALESTDRDVKMIHNTKTQIPWINADRDRLKQIVLNIMGNALQHTPAGGNITVYYQIDDKYISTMICDSGYGIPEDKIGMIFEKFYRADSDRSPTGSGLGLSIVRHLVELHAGKVTATNNIDHGVTMTFSLPR